MQRIAGLLLTAFLLTPLVLADDLPGRLRWEFQREGQATPPGVYRWTSQKLFGLYPYAIEPGHRWSAYEFSLAGEPVDDGTCVMWQYGPEVAGRGCTIDIIRAHQCAPMDYGVEFGLGATSYADMDLGYDCNLRPFPPAPNTATHWHRWQFAQPDEIDFPLLISIPVLSSVVLDDRRRPIGYYDGDAVEFMLVADNWQEGDLNCNGLAYELADLAVLLANYATAQPCTYLDGDLDTDGDVDLLDLAKLLEHFGD